MIDIPIAVCSRTFSRHNKLREAILERFSNVTFNDAGVKLTDRKLVEFLKKQRGVIVALEPLSEDIIKELPNLKYVSKYGVGLDNIDLDALTRHNIHLGHTAGLNKRSVSELTLGFILDLSRKITRHSQCLTSEALWKNLGGRQISDLTIGIIGLGNVGQDLVKLIMPFNMRVIGNDIKFDQKFGNKYGIEQVSKEQIYREADIISLHVPYTKDTHQLIKKTELQLMKQSAILINTSRGNIVDELDLAWALENKKIAGAAMDVFANEPEINSPLFKYENFIATPHIGGSSDEGIMNMGLGAISNLEKLILTDSEFC